MKEKLKQFVNFFDIKFRQYDIKNDKLHFYGSSLLCLFLTLVFRYSDPMLNSFGMAIITTNFLGLLLEIYEWQIAPHYSHPMFKKQIFKKYPFLLHISGDGIFDWKDVKLNLFGSLLVFPFIKILHLIKKEQ